MKKNKNEIYTLVDEEYLSKFSFNHQATGKTAATTPPYMPSKIGIPFFYFYVRAAIALFGLLILLIGIWLPFPLELTFVVIGVVFIILGLLSTFFLYRCPLCKHTLVYFNIWASPYQTQHCRTCGKAVYSDHTIRTPKEYLQHLKQKADAQK